MVQVADDQGQALAVATVRIENEGLRHRVNKRTGKWRGTTIYPQNEEPVPFRERDVVHITATAPGYLPRTILYRFRPFRNSVRIPLEPLSSLAEPEKGMPSVNVAALLGSTRVDCAGAKEGPPQVWKPAVHRQGPLLLDPDTIGRLGDLETADPWLSTSFSTLMLAQGPSHVETALAWADVAMAEAHTTVGDDYVGLVHDLFRVRALGHHLQWQQWELTALDDPSRHARNETERARRVAAEVATEWVEWADAADRDTELAAALCMAASDKPLECTP